jgi:hypothetical protein
VSRDLFPEKHSKSHAWLPGDDAAVALVTRAAVIGADHRVIDHGRAED